MIAYIDRIAAKKVVPVVVLQDADHAEPLAQALLDGGLDIMEITFRTDAAEESIKRIRAAFPEMLLGAGTLLDAEQVTRAHAAGAVFGLAPGLNEDVYRNTRELGMAFAAGVMTPTEVHRALELGCQLLKFFPAGAAGGAKMLAAMAAPFEHRGVRFIPTGGIHSGNLGEYLALPCVAAVGGSWMVAPKLVQEGAWSEITRLTKEALAAADAVSA